jgi:hypothetical protein
MAEGLDIVSIMIEFIFIPGYIFDTLSFAFKHQLQFPLPGLFFQIQ